MKRADTAVSILLPCRDDDSALLKRAVDSVLAQSFKDFELLIVDDGSRERFRAPLRAQAERDPRIRLIRQEPADQAGAFRRFRGEEPRDPRGGGRVYHASGCGRHGELPVP